MIEQFLTTDQVAKLLQVHPFTILKFIKQGKLRGAKLGRVYRIKESDVQEFLEERMIDNRAPRETKAKSMHSVKKQPAPPMVQASPQTGEEFFQL